MSAGSVAKRDFVHIHKVGGLCLLLLAFLSGCGKSDPLVLLRVAVDPAALEAMQAYDGHFFRHLKLDVPGARGDHEVGIICDAATWQTFWQQREFLSWYSGPVQPYQNVPFLGERGLDCDQIPNCHYVGRLRSVDCPDSRSEADWHWPKAEVSFHFSAVVQSKFEIVVLTSRSQRGLASLPAPDGGYQPPSDAVPAANPDRG